jgi:hypothetical protein
MYHLTQYFGVIMATATSNTTINYTLNLSSDEADYLVEVLSIAEADLIGKDSPTDNILNQHRLSILKAIEGEIKLNEISD